MPENKNCAVGHVPVLFSLKRNWQGLCWPAASLFTFLDFSSVVVVVLVGQGQKNWWSYNFFFLFMHYMTEL